MVYILLWKLNHTEKLELCTLCVLQIPKQNSICWFYYSYYIEFKFHWNLIVSTKVSIFQYMNQTRDSACNILNFDWVIFNFITAPIWSFMEINGLHNGWYVLTHKSNLRLYVLKILIFEQMLFKITTATIIISALNVLFNYNVKKRRILTWKPLWPVIRWSPCMYNNIRLIPLSDSLRSSQIHRTDYNETWHTALSLDARQESLWTVQTLRLLIWRY